MPWRQLQPFYHPQWYSMIRDTWKWLNCYLHSSAFEVWRELVSYGWSTWTGMLDRAVMAGLCTSVTVNVDFQLGSSKHGNARLANVGWNLELTMALRKIYRHLPLEFCWYATFDVQGCHTMTSQLLKPHHFNDQRENRKFKGDHNIRNTVRVNQNVDRSLSHLGIR